MTMLPSYVEEAFTTIYGSSPDPRKIESFASRWGALDIQTFQRVLKEGHEKDRAIAIFALGSLGTPEAQAEVTPFLSSPIRLERWASALCLGKHRHEQAYLVLQSMLIEGLSPAERPWIYEGDFFAPLRSDELWYDSYRPRVVRLLEPYTAPSVVPTMRQALQLLWELEKAGHPYLFQFDYQDFLCYALGERAAFDALPDLDWPPAYHNVARVYLTLGYLHAYTRAGKETNLDVLLEEDETLQKEVAHLLTQHFALSKEELEACVINFEEQIGTRNHLRRAIRDKRLEEDLAEINAFDEQEEDLAEINAFDEQDENDENDEDNEISTILPPLSSSYHGHLAPINSLSWSPDGTQIVSGSDDQTAHAWSASSGKPAMVFREHTASVNVVSWNPVKNVIASGGSDNIVYVWDATTGETISSYRQHTGWICCGLCWSPDGTRLASASWDKTVHVWDAFSGETLLIYRGHQAIVYSVTWSPDGSRIASGSGYPECAIHIWDATTGAPERIYNHHLAWENSVHHLVWSPDSTYIASTGPRFDYRIWNARTGEDIIDSDHTDGPLAWSPDSRYIASEATGEGGVDIRQPETNKLLCNYYGGELFLVTALAWSPDGFRLAAAGKGRGNSNRINVCSFLLP